jgi:hypothetical protein
MYMAEREQSPSSWKARSPQYNEERETFVLGRLRGVSERETAHY